MLHVACTVAAESHVSGTRKLDKGNCYTGAVRTTSLAPGARRWRPRQQTCWEEISVFRFGRMACKGVNYFSLLLLF